MGVEEAPVRVRATHVDLFGETLHSGLQTSAMVLVAATQRGLPSFLLPPTTHWQRRGYYTSTISQLPMVIVLLNTHLPLLALGLSSEATVLLPVAIGSRSPEERRRVATQPLVVFSTLRIQFRYTGALISKKRFQFLLRRTACYFFARVSPSIPRTPFRSAGAASAMTIFLQMPGATAAGMLVDLRIRSCYVATEIARPLFLAVLPPYANRNLLAYLKIAPRTLL